MRYETTVAPDPLLEAIEMGWHGPNVVAIGGGRGLAAVLEAAQQYAGEITAVVTVADDGGSSGRLTSVMDIPPPGDLRKALLALSPEPSLWREMFAYRFEEGDVRGHSLGNLILAALTEVLGDFEAAVRAAGRYLGSAGRVLPVARRSLHLQAVIDGVLVDGQAAITKTRGRISELRVVPEDEPANPAALAAIASADQIVIGPGSLYTSVLPALMTPGVVDAVQDADAVSVYVCNLVTQDGETLGMDAVSHVQALLGMAQMKPPATIVVNRAEVQVPPPVEPVRADLAALEQFGSTVIAADLVDPSADWPAHDLIRLGATLCELT